MLSASCEEGLGFHSLYQKGCRLWRPPPAKSWTRKGLIVFSPNLSKGELLQEFSKDTLLLNSWDKVIAELEAKYKKPISVSVFPLAPLALKFSSDLN